jgi:hypothetical protein
MPYFQPAVLTFAVIDPATGTPAAVAVDVSCAVVSATITSTTTKTDRNTLCGKHTIVGDTARTLDLDYDQEWADVDDLARFLEDNHGRKAEFVLAWAGEKVTMTGTANIERGPFGGPAGELAEGTVSLGVDGDVVPTYDPAADPAATTGRAKVKADA